MMYRLIGLLCLLLTWLPLSLSLSLSLCFLQDPGYAAFLLEQIQAPGGLDAGKGCCQVCSTPLRQLKQEALQTIHAPVQLSYGADMPALSTSSFLRQPSRIAISSSASDGKPPAKAQSQCRPALPPGERQRGLPWPQVSSHHSSSSSSFSSSSSSVTPLPSGPKTSVQVTVGGGQLTGTVSSVTIQAQQYLEGMWSISRVNHFLPQPGPVGSPVLITLAFTFRAFSRCLSKAPYQNISVGTVRMFIE